MGNAIVTFKVMPENPDVDLEKVKEQALEIAKKHGAKGELQSKIEPVAFGLKQVLIYGMYEMSDDKDFDEVTEEMGKLDGVNIAEVANMDLAMG
ncbi:MAG: elongation factor 1-beta [Candidatus Woesearchaeota archaeon]